ncbi:hypothetical protein C0Q70_14570 [Pomacea canaliculata]|uniref:Uncharacterized protein n=1 Tax=Pomacea canaliculata TaxID=400727 RepID=A0A2T7NSF1_POMCA|nr:hypothetical protein C0Q70_14570 [Pomacea canaliculata]
MIFAVPVFTSGVAAAAGVAAAIPQVQGRLRSQDPRPQPQEQRQPGPSRPQSEDQQQPGPSRTQSEDQQQPGPSRPQAACPPLDKSLTLITAGVAAAIPQVQGRLRSQDPRPQPQEQRQPGPSRPQSEDQQQPGPSRTQSEDQQQPGPSRPQAACPPLDKSLTLISEWMAHLNPTQKMELQMLLTDTAYKPFGAPAGVAPANFGPAPLEPSINFNCRVAAAIPQVQGRLRSQDPRPQPQEQRQPGPSRSQSEDQQQPGPSRTQSEDQQQPGPSRPQAACPPLDKSLTLISEWMAHLNPTQKMELQMLLTDTAYKPFGAPAGVAPANFGPAPFGAQYQLQYPKHETSKGSRAPQFPKHETSKGSRAPWEPKHQSRKDYYFQQAPRIPIHRRRGPLVLAARQAVVAGDGGGVEGAIGDGSLHLGNGAPAAVAQGAQAASHKDIYSLAPWEPKHHLAPWEPKHQSHKVIYSLAPWKPKQPVLEWTRHY